MICEESLMYEGVVGASGLIMWSRNAEMDLVHCTH